MNWSNYTDKKDVILGFTYKSWLPAGSFWDQDLTDEYYKPLYTFYNVGDNKGGGEATSTEATPTTMTTTAATTTPTSRDMAVVTHGARGPKNLDGEASIFYFIFDPDKVFSIFKHKLSCRVIPYMLCITVYSIITFRTLVYSMTHTV